MSYKFLTDDLTEDQLSKAQAMISSSDKARVGTSSADKGIHAFLIQHAYANVANFITANNLTYLDRELITGYIAGGFNDPRQRADSGVAGNPSGGSKRATATRTDKAAKDATVQRARPEKSTRGRD